MSFPDKPREPRTARRARPCLSLKMQAIGFLSRREHSRQELRAKLLDSLRKRAREDAALAAAAEELAREAQAQPSNGIDDAFAPRMAAPADVAVPASRAPAPAPAPARGRKSGRERGSGVDVDRADAGGARSAASGAGASAAAARSTVLDALTLATGAALPSRLRERLDASADASAGHAPSAARADAATSEDAPAAVDDDAPGDAELERTDPEAAVDRLLDWLAAHKYLSDARFVESRVNARSRKQGTLRIKMELSRHGLALEPEQAATLRETEFARAQSLWQRKFGEVAADPRQRARQARFLAARGFAADVVRRVVGGEEEF